MKFLILFKESVLGKEGRDGINMGDVIQQAILKIIYFVRAEWPESKIPVIA